MSELKSKVMEVCKDVPVQIVGQLGRVQEIVDQVMRESAQVAADNAKLQAQVSTLTGAATKLQEQLRLAREELGRQKVRINELSAIGRVREHLQAQAKAKRAAAAAAAAEADKAEAELSELPA